VSKNVRNKLLNVVKDRPPFFNSCHYTCKVIVGQNHLSSFFRNIGTPDTHGDADIGLLERRRIISAVTGNRHYISQFLIGAHYPEFVFRIDPCKNDLFFEFFI
jgi:hypothetical protein